MNEYWGFISQVGLWGWIITVIIFIHVSFPSLDRFMVREAFRWGAISLMFFTCWITGMVLA